LSLLHSKFPESDAVEPGRAHGVKMVSAEGGRVRLVFSPATGWESKRRGEIPVGS
jgi:hypothetical protein